VPLTAPRIETIAVCRETKSLWNRMI